ncbi:MAG: hypothetical protein R2867_36830 [Caldilineaceae bacterium]
MIYLRFLRFLLPLAVTSIVLELGTQVLNAGMARVPQPTITLAGFGVAWGLVLFFTSPLAQAKELGLVMGDGPAARKQVRRFVIGLGVLLSLGLGLLAVTPIGHFAIEDLHNIEGTLATIVRTMLLWLLPYPLIRGTSLYHAGLLIRHRRTELVSYAIVASIATSIALVFLLLPLPQTKPCRFGCRSLASMPGFWWSWRLSCGAMHGSWRRKHRWPSSRSKRAGMPKPGSTLRQRWV